MRKENYLAFLPAALAFVVAFAAVWFYGFEKVAFGDALDYMDAANSILNGTAYPRRGEFHPVFRAPVFPSFIALVWTFFPNSAIAFKIAQIFLHGAGCFVVYKITFELVRKIFPAFLAATVCAVNPLLFGHTVDFYSESLQILLVALSFFVLVKILKSDERLYYKSILLGVLFGLSTLCRPTIFPILLCLIPLIFLLFVTNEKLRLKYFFASAVIALSLAATIAPWTYKNYRDTGEFILVVSGFGYNFWLGNHPDTIRLYEGSFANKEENQAFADYWVGDLPGNKFKELEETDKLSSLPINEQEKVWRREAFKNIEANPAITGRLFWGKIKSYWTPFLNKFTYPFPLVVLTAILVAGLYVFSIYGAVVLWRDQTGRKLVVLLVIQFVLATVLHALIIANVRYRTPYVDPYLTILAAIAVWQIAVRFFPNNKFLNE